MDKRQANKAFKTISEACPWRSEHGGCQVNAYRAESSLMTEVTTELYFEECSLNMCGVFHFVRQLGLTL